MAPLEAKIEVEAAHFHLVARGGSSHRAEILVANKDDTEHVMSVSRNGALKP